MLTIIIFVLIAVIVEVIIIKRSNKKGMHICNFYHLISLVCLGICSICAIAISMYPMYGFKEPVLKQEISLQELETSYKTETDIYLVIPKKDTYIFKNKDSKQAQTDNADKLTYVETTQCKAPVMRIYERKAKAGLFAVGGTSITEVEFYLPRDSVLEVL